jgi:GT2 family glycosyltransferase
MSLAVIIVGIDGWEKYTLPLIESIRENEPGLKIIVIDNCSSLPYPPVEGVSIVRTSNCICYSEALNYGIAIAGRCDWYMLLNNDVIVKKPFMRRVGKLDPSKLHGLEKHTFQDEIKYICGWFFLISEQVIDNIGLFDERFKGKWFEDVDYCIRAKKSGVEIQIHNPEGWGFEHLRSEKERELMRDRLWELYGDNRRLLKEKHGIE